MSKLKISAIILFFYAIALSGCTNYKKLTYFRDLSDTLTASQLMSKYIDPIIETNDLLYVSIQTLDPLNNNIISGTNTSVYTPYNNNPSAAGQSPSNGYLVDRDGFIELPLAGKINVRGLTTTEAKKRIHDRAAIYYKEPVINVRFANFNVTVLGEVNRPSQFNVTNERITILDALGLANDLTIYGRRDNIMVIREQNGVKEFARVDINKSNIVNSPYFYLKQNDVIYVEPLKTKAATADAIKSQRFGVIVTIISAITSVTIVALNQTK